MLEKLSSPIEVEIRWSSGVLDLGAVERADVGVLDDDEHAAVIAWLSVTNSGDHRPLRRSCDRIISTGASR